MSRSLVRLALCAGLFLAGSAVADAGPYRNYVPIPSGAVPQSRPVPEFFNYYLRADLGLGWPGSRDPGESGIVYGAGQTSPVSQSGLPTFFQDNIALTGGIGAGMYFTPQLRGDITLDFRRADTGGTSGAYTAVGPTDIRGTVNDTFRQRSTVLMANLYWDLIPRGSFTPYVGAGVGMAFNATDRSYNQLEEVCGASPCVGPFIPGASASARDSSTSVSLAAAAMAGFSFAFSPAMAFDVNYRLMYIQGSDVSMPVTLADGTTYNSKLNTGDLWEHQVRAGIRWNLW